MDVWVGQAALMLLLAVAVSMTARKLRMPYTVGLVLAGIVFAFAPLTVEVPLTKAFVFGVLLPPLIFEASYQLSWTDLRRQLGVILVLATVGVGLSTIVVAAGMHLALGWNWGIAALVAALLSATDPVSVIAIFKHTGLKGKLRVLIESESLFNDGTAAALFATAVAAASGRGMSLPHAAWQLIVVVVGGIGIGAAVGGLVLLLSGHTDDHLEEITFTTIAAYVPFLIAEHFHVSGVLGTLSAGLLVGTFGPRGLFSSKGRDALESFWEYVCFVSNSLIFLLIGMHLAHQKLAAAWAPCILAIGLALLGRSLAVYGCSFCFQRSRQRVEMRHQHILVWGGLRGALSLGLVVGLPMALPGRDLAITVVFAVVAFSVLVQGISIDPLMRRLGLLGAHGKLP